MKIKVRYIPAGFCCEGEAESIEIDVPENATFEEIQSLAEKAALDDICLNVYWDDMTPKHRHAAVRQERTLTDEAAIVDVCECGFWRYPGVGGWNEPPLPVKRIVRH